MNKKAQTVVKVGGGLLVGFVNGFFGGGGGMLCVPLLEKVLGEPTKKAHATAILIILPISIASAVTYLVNGYFSLAGTLSTGGGVIAGGAAGALLLKKLPPFVVGIIFALMMVGVGARLAFFS
ncbi:MAG: TSUP family transporter [Clostridia bacterium]|uniref:TSUP family transporter n=1 Tax=Pumilibacter muris TaxID=2941510 RepID=UPI00203D3C3F|nr:TSUP family transporter [Pumilibacter muris]MCI8595624.1 TSUP family transporter [Clostridia bacterium]